jgi:hypothetical protein
MKKETTHMTQFHGGTKLPRTLHKGTEPKPNPLHGGSGAPRGVVHAAPAAGGSVNRGGTFGMGALKKRK